MRIGILGAGRIAATLADTMNKMDEVELYGIASRDIDRAKKFALAHDIPHAFGSYEEMLSDPQVELVYIATPHSLHYEHMKLCISYGKPILCEKAFTLNATQAREICALAEQKKVFLTEAIWTRYMPSREIINRVLKSGVIGEIRTATANLCYDIDDKERLVRPELAGGALLDVGIYGLTFFIMHLGKEIERMESCVQMSPEGVDAQESITFIYKNGTMAVTTHSMYTRSDRKGVFYGEHGYIVIDNINNPANIDVYDDKDQLISHESVPEQISGYEYQIRECIRQIEAGKLETESMPHSESIWMMELMDNIRRQWNFVYPMELAVGVMRDGLEISNTDVTVDKSLVDGKSILQDNALPTDIEQLLGTSILDLIGNAADMENFNFKENSDLRALLSEMDEEG